MLQLHNECGNVWTHLLAVVLMTKRLLAFTYYEDVYGDPYTWPLCAGLLSGIVLYATSSLAHCLHSKSEKVHYVAFMCDFAAIGVYGLGSVIVHEMYCSEDNFYETTNKFFVPLGCFIASSICICCCHAKTKYSRPYPFAKKMWQITPVILIYLLLISPIWHRVATCFVYGIDCTDSITYHLHQMAWFVVAGIFFTCDYPQRWFPGKCDIFFHSHQVFHLAIARCTLIQMDGVYLDFKLREAVVHNRPEPSFMSAFGPLIIVLITNFFVIAYFAIRVKKQKIQKIL